MLDAATADTLPAPPLPLPQRCTCCSLPISDREWRELRYVGLQTDGNGGWLELRNHGCGTTLSRPVLCGCGAPAVWLEDGQWLCCPCQRDWGMR